MENKPIITCHGDQTLFSSLHAPVVRGLPREPVVWRRSYGRPPRTIHVETNFVPFNPEILPTSNEWTLLGRPFFHTYWTDCDIDTYKTVVKDDIADWISSMKKRNISDWLITVVVYDENRVKSKILRTSVYDKIRNDFCNKHRDKCFALQNPFKNEVKSAESWANLLARIRSLLLESYNRNLLLFEENMRNERERRTHPQWSFYKYFLLQEELAFMFEMLGLCEDALIQYDELDALFTQFLLNHTSGDTTAWVTKIAQTKIENWNGICLTNPINIEKRQLISNSTASLLDFRNYLFSRQCTLLFLLYRPAEVAQRTLPFMLNCLHEINSLEISLPSGALSCWIFLNCFEVLNTCEKTSKKGRTSFLIHSASLRDYARIQLKTLGQLCGLMPGLEPSTSHLLKVIDLTSGLTKNSQLNDESKPLTVLREGLSSTNAFQKFYLELSELTMVSFKHVSRKRSAKMIGGELASFYMKLNEPNKAEVFLYDLLKMYTMEGWQFLADQTRIQLAVCQKLLNKNSSYFKMCAHIAGSKHLQQSVKQFYQSEIKHCIDSFKETSENVYLRCSPAFVLTHIESISFTFNVLENFIAQIIFHSNLPEPIQLGSANVSLISSTDSQFSPDCSKKSKAAKTTELDLYDPFSCSIEKNKQMLSVNSYVYQRQEKVGGYMENFVISSGIAYGEKLHRMDSGPMMFIDTDITPDTSVYSIEASSCFINPGENRLNFHGKLENIGCYTLSQLSLNFGSVTFLHTFTCDSKINIICKYPSCAVGKLSEQEKLFMGVPEVVKLKFESGSFNFPVGAEIILLHDSCLKFVASFLHNSCIKIEPMSQNQICDFDLQVIRPITDASILESQEIVELKCKSIPSTVNSTLIFHSPFEFSQKLEITENSKLLFIIVENRNTTHKFDFTYNSISSNSTEVQFLTEDPNFHQLSDGSSMLTVALEICSEPCFPSTLSCQILIDYDIVSDEKCGISSGTCTYCFNLDNFLPSYEVQMVPYIVSKKNRIVIGCELQVDLHVLAATNCFSQSAKNLFYKIISNSFWETEETSKVQLFFNEEKACYVGRFVIRPLIVGNVYLPKVKLYYHSTLESKCNQNLTGSTESTHSYVSEDINCDNTLELSSQHNASRDEPDKTLNSTSDIASESNTFTDPLKNTGDFANMTNHNSDAVTTTDVNQNPTSKSSQSPTIPSATDTPLSLVDSFDNISITTETSENTSKTPLSSSIHDIVDSAEVSSIDSSDMCSSTPMNQYLSGRSRLSMDVDETLRVLRSTWDLNAIDCDDLQTEFIEVSDERIVQHGTQISVEVVSAVTNGCDSNSNSR